MSQNGTHIGEVRFIGPMPNRDKIFYGIELFDKKGCNNGTLDNLFYFKSRDGHGIFVTENRINKILPSIDNSTNSEKFTVGSRVIVKSTAQKGAIKYIGQTLFESWLPQNTIWYGIELESDNKKYHGQVHVYAITVENRIYFLSNCKYCIFVDQDNITLINDERYYFLLLKSATINEQCNIFAGFVSFRLVFFFLDYNSHMNSVISCCYNYSELKTNNEEDVNIDMDLVVNAKEIVAPLETSQGRYDRFEHFIRCIKNGNIDGCQKLLQRLPKQKHGERVLWRTRVYSFNYIFVLFLFFFFFDCFCV